MADEDGKHKCTVCAYDYSINNRIPKLLPCQHTLCSLCIENILLTAEEEDVEDNRSIKCPICREKSNIPVNGISFFLENYFVDTKSEISECDLCQNSGNSLRECSICNSTLCDTCFISHETKHADKKVKKQKYDLEERNSRVLRWARRRYEKIMPTLLVAKLSYSLSCDCSKGIKRIVQLGKGVWVQSNTPLLSHFETVSGRHNRVELHDSNVIDICSMGLESLVFVDAKGDIYIWNIHNHSKKFLCSLPSNMKATSIFVKNEEFLLVAVQNERANGKSNEGHLLTYDLTSNSFLETDKMIASEMRLKLVTTIDIHPKTGSWFLCDYDQGCVVIFSGLRILRYEGKLSIPKVEQTEDNLCIRGGAFKFRPRVLCCDRFWQTFVYDVGTRCIHVIDDSAKLNWIVFMDNFGPVADPNCLSVDRVGKLWVGDKHSGIIHVFDTDRYYNIYEGGEEFDSRVSLRDLEMGMSPALMSLMSDGPIREERGTGGYICGTDITRGNISSVSRRSNITRGLIASSEDLLGELQERAMMLDGASSHDPDIARLLQNHREHLLFSSLSDRGDSEYDLTDNIFR